MPTQDPGNCLIDHAGPAGGRGEWERLGQRSGVAAPEGLQSAGVGATRVVVREVSSQVCSIGWSRFRVSRACVTESVSPAGRRRCSSAWRSLRESHQRFVESGPGGSESNPTAFAAVLQSVGCRLNTKSAGKTTETSGQITAGHRLDGDKMDLTTGLRHPARTHARRPQLVWPGLPLDAYLSSSCRTRALTVVPSWRARLLTDT